jgi:fructose-bisphosphate aldolase class 1
MAREQDKMMKKMCSVDGFIAALDQSGGSSEYFPGLLHCGELRALK